MTGVKRESPDSSTPSSAPSTPKKPRAKKTDSDSPRQIRPWTAEEDAIFIELINEVLKENLYAKIKSDGKLDRACPAVKAHYVAFMNKVKKSG